MTAGLGVPSPFWREAEGRGSVHLGRTEEMRVHHHEELLANPMGRYHPAPGQMAGAREFSMFSSCGMQPWAEGWKASRFGAAPESVSELPVDLSFRFCLLLPKASSLSVGSRTK